jgi:hypothetical protein
MSEMGEETALVAVENDGMAVFEHKNLGDLARRIAAASLAVGNVEKRGRNKHFGYAYATAEDVKRAAREALAEQGLSIIPLTRLVEQRRDNKMVITRVYFDFVVACEEGYLVVPWVADSQDIGDKGINKCATVALKYFLINLLQIPTGDEDDADADGGKKSQKAPQAVGGKARGGNGKIPRPMDAEILLDALQRKVALQDDNGTPATEKQAPFLARKFQEALADQSNPAEAYHLALGWLWNVTSAKDLTLVQAKVTLDWLLDKSGPDDTGDIPLHEHAPEEARRALRVALKAQGQQDMFETAGE